jgi:hypothetical protein
LKPGGKFTICYQRSTANTLYSSSVIRRVSILADDESNTRPAFRQGSFFNGIDVNQAYLQTTQMATFTRILGSTELAKRYLERSFQKLSLLMSRSFSTRWRFCGCR